MGLDFLVGGMPRGGTTVAAKFMSLPPNMFCYAGETHLVPFMHSMFGHLPCRPDKVDLVKRFLHQQFTTALVEMPRFSVSQGAHPKNLIFDEGSVDELVEAVGANLSAGLYGEELYVASLTTLRDVLSKADPRDIRGEKTPSNVFAMADFASACNTTNVVVMREPFGVLRSMKARVEGGDSYANAFRGDVEANIGMYVEYAQAARQVLESAPDQSMLVRYEDMAKKPAAVMQEIYKLFDREPEERVIRFVEGKWDREIADRAPMNYRRLDVKAGFDALSPVDVWKIFNLSREVRDPFGYSDGVMAEFGFGVPPEWPDVEVPSKVFPLYGFHQESQTCRPWMKRRGGLLAYLPKGRDHHITLEFKSQFPELIPDEIELAVSVNGIRRETLKVAAGNLSATVNVTIHSEEIKPMGNKGGYVVIDLVSSKAYSQLGHTADGVDAREISFQLANWKIDKKSSRWWWR